MTLIECMIAFAVLATALGALMSYQYTIGQIRRQSLVNAVRSVTVNSLANLMVGSYAPEIATTTSPWSYGRSKNLTLTQAPMTTALLAQYHVISPEIGALAGGQSPTDYDLRVYVEYYRSMDNTDDATKKGLFDAAFATPAAWRNALSTASSSYEVIMPASGAGGLPNTSEVSVKQPILVRVRMYSGLTASPTEPVLYEIFTGISTN